MPLLFSLAIHDALKEVDSQLEANETLFAYLDDVCVVTSPEHTRPVYDLLGHHLQSMAGIQIHVGRTLGEESSLASSSEESKSWGLPWDVNQNRPGSG